MNKKAHPSKSKRCTFSLYEDERELLVKLARSGGTTQSAVLGDLVYREARAELPSIATKVRQHRRSGPVEEKRAR